MAVGVGLAGKVLASQQPLIFDRYGESDTALPSDLIEDAVIGLPIFWHNQMIGFFWHLAPIRRGNLATRILNC